MNTKYIITLLIIIIILFTVLTLINTGNKTPPGVVGVENSYFAVDSQPTYIDQYNIDIPIHYTNQGTFYMFWQPVINGVPGPHYKAVPPLGNYPKTETFPISITGDPKLPTYDTIELYASSDPEGRFAIQTETINL
jgi:hypothetical protein